MQASISHLRYFFLSLSLLLMVGCAYKATHVGVPRHLSGLQQTQLVEHIDDFQASGRIQLMAQGQRQTASFHWLEQDGQLDIEIFGPLGFGRAHLRIQQDGKSTLKAQGEVHEANSAEEILDKAIGFPLPVAALQNGIKGIPPKNLDINHQPVSYQVLKYAQNGSLKLPEKIKLSQGNTRVLLLIHEASVLSWK